MKTTLFIVLGALSVTSALYVNAPRALPTPVDGATARAYLSTLTIQPANNTPPYNRRLFPHWHTVNGTCNTRETVLKRDGTNVVTDRSCRAVSGDWVSPYDDVPTMLATDLDIDHVVPLKEAWVSGARLWTTAQREAFANDLTRPQLVAVTDDLNQAKGDKDPASWVPPMRSYICTYVRAFVHVKYFYKLTVDSTEKAALTKLLADC